MTLEEIEMEIMKLLRQANLRQLVLIKGIIQCIIK